MNTNKLSLTAEDRPSTFRAAHFPIAVLKWGFPRSATIGQALKSASVESRMGASTDA
jgi:hypothetical protein